MHRLLILAILVPLAACTPAPPAEEATLRIVALAGPTCPVVSEPPDPDCADRPVNGAEIIVQRQDGAEVTRMTTDADGRAVARLEPGTYLLVPQPVAGLMGTAGPVEITIGEGADPEPVTIAYDTGIR